MNSTRSPSAAWRSRSRAALPPLLLAALVSLGGLTACSTNLPPRTALEDEFSALLPEGAHLGRADVTTPPSADAWRSARERLHALRAEAQGLSARTLRVRFMLREPRSGRVLEARGAVAINPMLDPDSAGQTPGALRMILLGPGGTTALDLWTRGNAYRFALPALDLLLRGDATAETERPRGLPVDFLRWWLLRPASGDLVWYERAGATDVYVLRDGDATIELLARQGGAIAARRSTFRKVGAQHLRDEEIVIADRMGCGTVRYGQSSTGLLATIHCEDEARTAPNPRAFEDPDAQPTAP
ncbi:hypothetical protein [Chondromyces apiculatus]|uniref:Uncharacterized protein n=1 Tax=Chondromyces apiculatus DSM 436 TaxID=1192034 RepID=A0A017TI55_9BACT|nr:hypothetical protein [Chondromyces apiculatus]EYF08963.1 Hypothetical protein CAP_0047 [Chondromyces apiculatus DSM 436]